MAIASRKRCAVLVEVHNDQEHKTFWKSLVYLCDDAVESRDREGEYSIEFIH